MDDAQEDVAAFLDLGAELKVEFMVLRIVFDRTIETGKTAAGLLNVGAPRLILAGAHYRF